MLLHVLAAEAASNPPDVITTILQWGPPGVVIALLLTGVLVTKGQLEQMKTDRDYWRDAYQKEQTSHEVTRNALVDANQSASAAVETARATTQILSALGHSTQRPGIGGS